MDTGLVDLRKAVLSQNPEVQSAVTEDRDLRMMFKRRNRQPHLFNVVIEASPEVRISLLTLERLSIGHQRVRIQDFSSFVQCFRCLQFGHTQDRCKSQEVHCSHCGGNNHSFKDCINKDNPTVIHCFNCKTSNETFNRSIDDKHPATSAKDCPRIKAMIKRLKERTDFGTSS